jgi:hypothetical protein
MGILEPRQRHHQDSEALRLRSRFRGLKLNRRNARGAKVCAVPIIIETRWAYWSFMMETSKGQNPFGGYVRTV